jgi:hypothetical protein
LLLQSLDCLAHIDRCQEIIQFLCSLFLHRRQKKHPPIAQACACLAWVHSPEASKRAGRGDNGYPRHQELRAGQASGAASLLI